jgi:hypothetical protein
MAKSPETGNPTVTPDNPIADLLAAPLSPDWTVEGLAEQVLGAIAAQRCEEGREFVLDANAIADRQSRRLLRPLLACLAAKSAAEAGTSPNLYGGNLAFTRPGPGGRPVRILGRFENGPGTVRVAFRQSDSSPEAREPGSSQPAAPPAVGSGVGAPQSREVLDERHPANPGTGH